MVDRPRQSVPSDPNAEDDHADLLATLAAARELGPDMDKALAESYMQRRKANTPARPRNVEPRPPVNFGFVARGVLPFVAIAAFVALFILSKGWFWFLLFPFFWGGWWWRRGWGYGRGRYGYERADRYSRRREYRDARRAERDEQYQARRDDRYDWS